MKKTLEKRILLRIIISVLVCSLLLFLPVKLVYSYLTDRERNNNILSDGICTTEITGTFTTPDKQVLDNTYISELIVHNTGTVPCFIRIYVNFNESGILDISSFSDEGDSGTFYPADTSASGSFASYINGKPDDSSGQWRYMSDDEADNMAGYYYYTVPVRPGESTKALFNRTKTSYSDLTEIRQYELIAYSEAVQSISDDGNENADYKVIWQNFLDNP